MQNKYFKLVSHALLLFHRSLIIKACKTFVILHSALCDTLTREFQWKFQKTITEKEIVKVTKVRMSMASLYLMGVWLQFWKAVSQISIWLAKKTASTIHYSLILFFVRQKYGWKGNGFDRRMKTLECAWHSPDVGKLALLLPYHQQARRQRALFQIYLHVICILMSAIYFRVIIIVGFWFVNTRG